MFYNGNVTVGGPAAIQETPATTIIKVAVGPYNNNAYLLVDRATKKTLLIDAAAEANTILDLCDGELSGVLTTHSHLDHCQALAAVVTATGATTYATAAEAKELSVPTDVIVDDGDTIRFGDSVLLIRTLRGHRAAYTDHVANSAAAILQTEDGETHAFVGDSLFPGGVGNTCKDSVAFADLLRDVKSKLFALPDTTSVYPGHGSDTTIGSERPHLAEWSARGW